MLFEASCGLEQTPQEQGKAEACCCHVASHAAVRRSLLLQLAHSSELPGSTVAVPPFSVADSSLVWAGGDRVVQFVLPPVHLPRAISIL